MFDRASEPGAPAKRVYPPGTAGAALAQPDFRRMYIGGFASQIGSWMQTVVLGPFALRLSGGSATFAGIVMLAQLGPLLVFAVVGGSLAARVQRRKRYLISLNLVQVSFAVGLAILALNDRPGKGLLVLVVLGGGVCNALSGPLFQTILPEIVGRENIPGAVSLGSAQVNGSRVIGPVLLAVASTLFKVTPTLVFALNALTFLAVIWAVMGISIPGPPPRRETDSTGLGSLLEGFQELKRNPVAARVLFIMFWFSMLSLAYVPQFPKLAEQNLRIDSASRLYLTLFGVWGLGALSGSLSMSTVLAKVDKRRVPQFLLAGFAVLIAIFGNLTSVWPAYVIGFLLGFCYFGTTTALNTVLQTNLDSRTRGPVLALWFMCFGGTVPLAGMWGGWVMDHGIPGILENGSATAVLLIGAAAAGWLAMRAKPAAFSAKPSRST